MKNIFNTIQVKKQKRNVFDLTHDVKLTTKMGKLTPICMVETVPGDSITLAGDTFIRFAPLLFPIMHKVDVTCHYFFVPNRILWDNWQDFITNTAAVQHPFITVTDGMTSDEKKFLDYLGIPPVPTGGVPTQVNALPLSAYACIYNEYYRDQNLVPEVQYKLNNGDNTSNTDLFILRDRSYEHDYFTACLPFAQKGASVSIPIGEISLKDDWSDFGSPEFVTDPPGLLPAGQIEQPVNITTPGIGIGGTGPLAYDPKDTLTVGATQINDLRRAFRLQEWLEKNARGGTRYIENILMHFGVKSSDKRLQRPEYITGTKSPIVISEVLNTTGEIGGLPQGNMAGHGVSIGGGYNGKYYAEEHGWIIGIMSVMPKPAYQQGIHKSMLRNDPLEYFWPSFAHIGEQEVKVKEIYAYDPDSEDTFGYIPRYAEYKYVPNRVAGDFRDTLKDWHLGRIFANAPTLSQEFLEPSQEDMKRIFAVIDPDEDYLWCQVLNKIKAVRPMPVFGTPMM
jgi:hypothetical protein